MKSIIGVVVDMSSSMKRNWGFGEIKLSRIEYVVNSLNNYFLNIYSLGVVSEKSLYKIFCLGFGIKLPMKYNNVFTDDGEEVQGNESKIEVSDVICDLLALTQLVPTKENLEDVRHRLNSTWKANANRFIQDADSMINPYPELESYLRGNLLEKARSNWRYRMLVSNETSEGLKIKVFLNKLILYLLGLRGNKSNEINKIVVNESKRYINAIRQEGDKVFESNKSNYEEIIKKELEVFAENEIHFLLSKYAIGFKIEDLIQYFDYEKTEEIVEKIYSIIEKDVNKRIAYAWNKNKLQLVLESYVKAGANLDIKYIKSLTKNCIRYTGWMHLKPFIEKIVNDIFDQTFRKVINNILPRWIHYAVRKEEILSLDSIQKILPNSSENIYSEKYIFGTTPMLRVLERASMRFLKNEFSDHEKYLVVISDGEFEKVNQKKIFELGDMLKNKGVIIICLYVHSKDVINTLITKLPSMSNEGVDNLYKLSSAIKDCQKVKEYVFQKRWYIEDETRLIYQLNESEKIKKVFDSIISE